MVTRAIKRLLSQRGLNDWEESIFSLLAVLADVNVLSEDNAEIFWPPESNVLPFVKNFRNSIVDGSICRDFPGKVV